MEMINVRKKIDTAISDPTIRNEARRYSVGTRLAFLPDECIGRSWVFRLLTLFYYYTFIYFHAFEIVGMEKIDRHKQCLFIARHSTHNGDIVPTVVLMYHETGRVLRSLVHRYLIPSFPLLRLLGWVSGERKTAISLLKSGFWVGVVPGGADEGMIGHENAYKVCWPKQRKGFAKIAIEAEAPIVPIFVANTEEIRWNPILALWNFLGLGRLFTNILQANIPFRHALIRFYSVLWFLITFIQIPIPAKVTLYVGDPVEYDTSKDTIDDVVERSRNALQSLINRHQPYGKSYTNAVNERFQCFTEYWKKTLLN